MADQAQELIDRLNDAVESIESMAEGVKAIAEACTASHEMCMESHKAMMGMMAQMMARYTAPPKMEFSPSINVPEAIPAAVNVEVNPKIYPPPAPGPTVNVMPAEMSVIVSPAEVEIELPKVTKWEHDFQRDHRGWLMKCVSTPTYDSSTDAK